MLDLLFTSDGAMVISAADAPIFFFKDGKDYNTQRMVFTKEGSKFSIIKAVKQKMLLLF